MVRIGTSGFSFKDWIGPFYPDGTRPGDMLRLYARHFDVVELDFTYYSMPGLKTMLALERKTPDGFEFCVKANRAMTHEPPADRSELARVFEAFRYSLEPLVEARKLGCLLFQFPWRFRPGAQAADYLRRLPGLLPDLPLVIEFRRREWVEPGTRNETVALLRQAGLGFCAVDEPPLRGLMPRLVLATSPVGYVRFHGRNAARWWRHENPSERYDYLYSVEELTDWIPRIRAIEAATEKTYVLFNNCHVGHAPRNARMMLDLLAGDAA